MKFLKFIPAFAFLFLIENACAQTKIGIIDTSKITEKSTAYTEASKLVGNEIKNYDESVTQVGKSFSKKVEDLEKKKNVMSSKEYNRKRDELAKEEEELQKKFYDQRVKIDKKVHNINQILDDNLKKIVNVLAKEKNITIIFNKAATLYSDDSIDITDDIITKLNKELKSIDINLPQNKSSDSK
ncbi:OmpH family outer membrane protein [Rickettsiales endosymbiont of Trichoplax sp. H2]|uniref:OmpH family outer membrane protein n=1 Tax=Rickettsiales endosymbiont of Trichoplax sp. H2 TaxID=2021221 RepID=UPI0012B3630E|nr:OmpH family outer membrane protein [Rickettsiales endosymbiont of Trichoplax sp. H2]MSO14190.1 Uncharacterized protein [Rickettsiales endosymbiont of Trichoplax sp. H2]